MKKILFDKKELVSTENYPLIMNDYMTKPGYYTAKLNTPVTPRENWELFWERKGPLWVPDGTYDFNYMCPLFHPDIQANSFSGGYDSFGVKWVPNPSFDSIPAFPEHGAYRLKSISDWRELHWPDVDSWGWEQAAEEYSVQDVSRPNAVFYVCGLFERMISLLGYENAAISFYMDPQNTHAFIDRLLEHNLNVFEHFQKYLKMELMLFSDDWGTQLHTTFSKKILEEFIMAHYATLVKWCHDRGIRFMHHCCGEVTSFVPYMIDAGTDSWEMNFEAVEPHLDECVEKYGDKILFDAYIGLVKKLPAEKEALKESIRGYYAKYGAGEKFSLTFYDYNDWDFDTRSFCYQEARKVICGAVNQ